MGALVIRKLADQTAERVKMFHPVTGEALLMEPEGAEALMGDLAGLLNQFQATPRPFLGIEIEGDPPTETQFSTNFVAQGRQEGWIEVVGEERVFRSSGPPENPWGTPPHVFLHYEKIIIKTVNGDLVYKVTEQPDKWPETKSEEDEAGFGGDVKWIYTVELEEV